MLTRFTALLVAFMLLWSGLAAHAQAVDAGGFSAQAGQVELSATDGAAGDGDTWADLLDSDELAGQNHAEHFLDLEAVPTSSLAAIRPVLTPDRPLSRPITAPPARYLDGLQRPPSQAALQA